MRIIHVVDSMDPTQGGPPIVVASLAAAQAQLGHEVEIVSLTSPRNSTLPASALAGIPSFELVTLTLLQQGGLGGKYFPAKAATYLKSRITNVDILHLHGLWQPLLLAAARIAKAANVKSVIAPHGMLAPWCLQQKRLKKRLALAVGWRKLLSGAFFLHMLNADEALQAKPLGLKAPVQVIPNGIFPEQIENLPERSTFRRLFPQLGDKAYILFLGRLHYVKGLDYLAEAFGQFASETPSVDLVVVGPDYGAGGSFRERIVALGVEKRVHMMGPLYGPQKYAALIDALCICQPSRYEGFSMTITEAMGCGLPVVITKNCNFPEVAETSAGIVVELNTAALCTAFRRVANDENWRQQAGQAARELVLSRFTWPAIADRSIGFYSGGS